MNFKKYLALGTALTLDPSRRLRQLRSGDDQIVIYSNADEEAITAMENALDAGGYEASISCRPTAPPSWGASCWPRAPT